MNKYQKIVSNGANNFKTIKKKINIYKSMLVCDRKEKKSFLCNLKVSRPLKTN